MDLLAELKGLTGDPQRFNQRLIRVDELRNKIHQESRAYRIVNAFSQLAELRRYSADRRLSVPETFLACDSALNLYLNVMEGPTVYPKVIEKHLHEELPFMATENILMACVKKGGDRQEVHEVIRKHSMEAGARVKEEGAENDLLKRLADDDSIPMNLEEIESALDLKAFVGRAPMQVTDFIKEYVDPVLERHQRSLGAKAELHV